MVGKFSFGGAFWTGLLPSPPEAGLPMCSSRWGLSCRKVFGFSLFFGMPTTLRWSSLKAEAGPWHGGSDTLRSLLSSPFQSLSRMKCRKGQGRQTALASFGHWGLLAAPETVQKSPVFPKDPKICFIFIVVQDGRMAAHVTVQTILFPLHWSKREASCADTNASVVCLGAKDRPR